MDDTRKPTAQLMAALNELRQRVAEWEASAVVRQQPESQRDELLARWQLVLDNMPLGGIIIDPDLRIAYWNAAAIAMKQNVRATHRTGRMLTKTYQFQQAFAIGGLEFDRSFRHGPNLPSPALSSSYGPRQLPY